MLLKEIKEHYGKDLPGKSAFRNDPDAPCTVEELSEEYGTWDAFVEKYFAEEEKAPAKKEAPAKEASAKPAPTTKKESDSDKAK